MSVLDLLRHDLRDFALYTAGDGDDTRVRLHTNELPFRAERDDSERGLHRYPLGRDPRLPARLARLYDVAPDQVLATRGSDDAIDLIVRAFCAAGRSRIVCTTPGFSMYPALARLQGCDTRSVELSADDSFHVDPAQLVDAVDDTVRLVFLCSPNNPTGRALPLATIGAVCDAVSDRALVVVDEAYAEFSSVASATTMLASHDNLVVLRTLSKAYGLASARVGAAVGGAALIAALDRLLMPFPLPAVCVELALSATEPRALSTLHSRWRTILEERARLLHHLRQHPRITKVWPSDANFLLLRCPEPVRLVALCREHGLLVRHIRGNGEDFVRVTIGQPEENNLFLGALEERAA